MSVKQNDAFMNYVSPSMAFGYAGVVEKVKDEREMSVFSALMRERIMFISNVTPLESSIIIGQLLYLQTASRTKEISMYIHSPGGFVPSGLAIYDTMQFVECDVATYCIGFAASFAALLLAAGSKGKRFALPNSKIMLHQPHIDTVVQGQASDVLIEAEEIERTKRRLNEILSYHTGQPVEKIEADSERNYWMNADQAKEYGIIDEVLVSPKLDRIK